MPDANHPPLTDEPLRGWGEEDRRRRRLLPPASVSRHQHVWNGRHPDAIYCTVWDGDPRRFVRFFREAWKAMPLTARRRIRRHWRRRGGWPNIEMMHGWSQRRIGTIGHVRLSGMEVRFHSPYLEWASDDHVRYVIAHELAHVLQAAEGRDGASSRDRESDAHKSALTWLGLTRQPSRTPALKDVLVDELTFSDPADDQ